MIRKLYSKRGPLEIKLGILKLLNDGPMKKTHIMYDMRMAWQYLQKQLKPLLSAGLVEWIDPIKRTRGKETSSYKGNKTKNEHKYHHIGLTAKGKKLIILIKEMEEYFKPIDSTPE